MCVCVYIYIYIYIYTVYILKIFIFIYMSMFILYNFHYKEIYLSEIYTCMCVYLYTQHTYIYYVNKCLFWMRLVLLIIVNITVLIILLKTLINSKHEEGLIVMCQILSL